MEEQKTTAPAEQSGVKTVFPAKLMAEIYAVTTLGYNAHDLPEDGEHEEQRGAWFALFDAYMAGFEQGEREVDERYQETFAPIHMWGTDPRNGLEVGTNIVAELIKRADKMAEAETDALCALDACATHESHKNSWQIEYIEAAKEIEQLKRRIFELENGA